MTSSAPRSTNALGLFDNPVWKPMAQCADYGIHDGYSHEYMVAHELPPELFGRPPTVPLSAPMAFVDGHVKYVRMNIYEALSYLTQPNQIE